MEYNQVQAILASYLSSRSKLKELVPNFNWSNLLGDYGEYIAIKKYNFAQAPPSTKEYDAIDKKGRTVQIKTIRETTRSIKFSKGADHLLVLEVKDDASYEEIYYGNFDKVVKLSSPTAKGEYTVGITKLKKIALNTFRPKQEEIVTLTNGKKLSAPTRKDLRQKLIQKGFQVPSYESITRRFGLNWIPERAYGIKVPPNYANVEHYVEEEGYSWFPDKPDIHGDREPVVSHFDKRVYISQIEFANEKSIPTDYVSDKLKLGWDTSRIYLTYQHTNDSI